MLKTWWRKVKRRKGGVYAFRTRKHGNPLHREWGYVGESNSFKRRERDHKGLTTYQGVTSKGKPWIDLDPKMHHIIPLPWWLCWKWVLRPLETLAILLLWPRYNDAKNRWNPRRVPLYLQARQRAIRDAGGGSYRARVAFGRLTRAVCQLAGILVIFAGVAAAVMDRA